MRIIGRPILESYCLGHAEVRSQVEAWICELEEADWQHLSDLRERYPSASILKGGRVVFNIKGNKYRLLARVNFKNEIVRIERIGTHAEYSKWPL